MQIGLTLDYIPFAYLDKQNKYTGFDVKFLELLNLGKHEFVATSWQNLHSDLINKKFDIAIGGISLTKYRKQKFLYSATPIQDHKVFLVNTLNKIQLDFDHLENIDNRDTVIVVNKGGTNEIFVEQNIKHAQIIKTENNLDAISILQENKADLMITDKVEAQYYLNIALNDSHASRNKASIMIKEPFKPLSDITEYGFLYHSEAQELKRFIDHRIQQLSNEQILQLKKEFAIYK
jgi:cyclohexadienyl dehydratase